MTSANAFALLAVCKMMGNLAKVTISNAGRKIKIINLKLLISC